MNSSNINICPICDGEIVNGICQTCGYVRLVFPEVVPDSISNMESERISIARKRVKGISDQLAEQQKQLSRSEKSVDDAKKDLKLKDDKVRSLQSTVESLEKEKSTLSRQLKDSTDTIEQLKARPIAPDAYFILNDGRKRTVLPIMKDKVCFFASGTASSLPQLAGKDVTPLSVMTPVKIAFMVEYGNSGFFRITDIAGSLQIIGHLGKTSAKLTNGCTIRFKGTDISLDFSQQ